MGVEKRLNGFEHFSNHRTHVNSIVNYRKTMDLRMNDGDGVYLVDVHSKNFTTEQLYGIHVKIQHSVNEEGTSDTF